MYKNLVSKFKPTYEYYWTYFFENIDLLVDGRFDQKLKTMDLKFRGSSNQKIYDMKQSIMLDKPILSDLN
jgi:anaerobic ribonucleoside-triphosphate reductase activating protein